MLRGENIVCGTSTTGTGTLTLAAVPAGVGGVDFDAWLKSTGVGFVSGNAILVSYTIIEYTTSAFAVPKFVEKGIGTLTLGASITAATLARTTVQTVSNANADTYQVGAGASAITIGTAANVLVFVGASAADIPAYEPYFENTLGDAVGVIPPHATIAVNGTNYATGTEYFSLFEWKVPMLVKRASIRVTTAYSGGVPVSNADGRLYAIGTDGRPGKLLYDFGLFGSAGTSLNAAGNISTGAAGNGFFLTPGEYYFGFLSVFSGGSTPPAIGSCSNSLGYIVSGRIGTSGFLRTHLTIATGGTIGAAPDPASQAGYAFILLTPILFALKSS